jgi:hypothetical protein
MCGIWGIFPLKGPIDKTDIDIAEQVITLTSLRGKDSTGVAVIPEGTGKPRTMKMVGGPEYLLNHDAYTKIMEFAAKKGVAMFGHGRFGTMGEALVKNAHPHTVDHITLVHNGTITYGLDSDHKEAETENDSLALCSAIAKRGLVEALTDVCGAYALIIYDSKKQEVFVVRNQERPLHQIIFQGRRVIMSEAMALEYLAIRNSYGNYKPETTYFKSHVIYSINLKTGELTSDNSLVDALAKKWKPSFTPLLGTTVPSFQAGSKAGGGTAGKTINRFIPAGMTILCVSVEGMPGGNMYKYTFVDESGQEVSSMSSTYLPDRVGDSAKCEEMTVVRSPGGVETQFTKFRGIKWDDVKEEKKEDLPKQVRFRNGFSKARGEARQILKERCCGLCNETVREAEIPDTILTADNGLICPDCIKHGRHFAFGFGQ